MKHFFENEIRKFRNQANLKPYIKTCQNTKYLSKVGIETTSGLVHIFVGQLVCNSQLNICHENLRLYRRIKYDTRILFNTFLFKIVFRIT